LSQAPQHKGITSEMAAATTDLPARTGTRFITAMPAIGSRYIGNSPVAPEKPELAASADGPARHSIKGTGR